MAALGVKLMDKFANIAETYDWTEQSTDDIKFFLNFAKKVQGPILEIGAGTGRITIPLSEQGNIVTALDISESMLLRAKAKCDCFACTHSCCSCHNNNAQDRVIELGIGSWKNFSATKIPFSHKTDDQVCKNEEIVRKMTFF